MDSTTEIVIDKSSNNLTSAVKSNIIAIIVLVGSVICYIMDLFSGGDKLYGSISAMMVPVLAYIMIEFMYKVDIDQMYKLMIPVAIILEAGARILIALSGEQLSWLFFMSPGIDLLIGMSVIYFTEASWVNRFDSKLLEFFVLVTSVSFGVMLGVVFRAYLYSIGILIICVIRYLRLSKDDKLNNIIIKSISLIVIMFIVMNYLLSTEIISGNFANTGIVLYRYGAGSFSSILIILLSIFRIHREKQLNK